VKNTEDLQKAKEYAFLLLKFRLRTEKELADRLKKKKFSEALIKETIEFLKEKKFINDKQFAKLWIESRLKKSLGLRRIKNELRIKGIGKEIIDNSLTEAQEGYSEDETIQDIVRRKIEQLKGIEPQKAKQRIYAYLVRRGFSSQAIAEAVSRIVAQ
jgi:regulatory protein